MMGLIVLMNIHIETRYFIYTEIICNMVGLCVSALRIEISISEGIFTSTPFIIELGILSIIATSILFIFFQTKWIVKINTKKSA